MDNQNKNKGGSGITNIFSNDTKISLQEDYKHATDASGQMGQENVVIQPQNYENVQTRSKVESAREDADRELAKIKAYNEEMLRRQKADERKVKAKRTAVYVTLGVFVLIFFGVMVWVLINALMTVQTPPEPTDKPGDDPTKIYNVVDGYKCKTEKCFMVTELPDHRYLIRDDRFFIYEKSSGEVVPTAVPTQEYHNITAFTWGEAILLELDPESELSGLYSITENRMITDGFSYDSFFRDIKDDVYKEMEWVYGQYIIGRANGSYRLIRLVDAQELVRGNEGVFIHGNFLFDYEAGGQRRVFTMDGKMIKSTPAETVLFTSEKTGCLILFKDSASISFEVYDAAGNKLTSGKSVDYQTISKVKSKERLKYVEEHTEDYYKIYAK